MSQFKKYLEKVQEENYNEGFFANAANKVKEKLGMGNKKEVKSSFSLDDNDSNRIEKMKINYKTFYDNFINKLRSNEKTADIYKDNKSNFGMLTGSLIKNNFLSESDAKFMGEIFRSNGDLDYILNFLFPNEYLKKTSTVSLVGKLNNEIKMIHMPNFSTEIETHSLTKGTAL